MVNRRICRSFTIQHLSFGTAFITPFRCARRIAPTPLIFGSAMSAGLNFLFSFSKAQRFHKIYARFLFHPTKKIIFQFGNLNSPDIRVTRRANEDFFGLRHLILVINPQIALAGDKPSAADFTQGQLLLNFARRSGGGAFKIPFLIE